MNNETNTQTEKINKLHARKQKKFAIKIMIINERLVKMKKLVDEYEKSTDYPEEDLEQLDNCINRIIESMEILNNITQ
jgi:CII-binding regulator of phage lambda lysogenization HflD